MLKLVTDTQLYLLGTLWDCRQTDCYQCLLCSASWVNHVLSRNQQKWLPGLHQPNSPVSSSLWPLNKNTEDAFLQGLLPSEVNILFVCLLFICLNRLYPPTHILKEDSHNTGNFIPYPSRIVCGFFNVPQGTNDHGRYLWEGTYGL